MDSVAVYIGPDQTLAAEAVDVLRSRLHKRGMAICISGMDGSGKTTLARQLVQTWAVLGIPVRHVCIYQWYTNVAVTPFLLCRNRYFDRKLLIFDRTVYDNLAVVGIRRFCRAWLLHAIVRVVTSWYPPFDHRICLQASLSEIRRRRPETSVDRIEALDKSYEQIARLARYTRFWSDPKLLNAVLRSITASMGK